MLANRPAGELEKDLPDDSDGLHFCLSYRVRSRSPIVSIFPPVCLVRRGSPKVTLGYTMDMPEERRHLMSKPALEQTSTGAAGDNERATAIARRILHYSDPHVAPRLLRVPLSDYLGKRLTGALSHLFVRRKKFPTVRRKLSRLADFAREESVDLVVCTGDHTMLGTEREMAEARVLANPFTQAPLGYVTVPGNHDLYTPDTVRHRRFEQHFGDLLESDLPDRAVDGVWPLVRLVGDQAAVIAVNSSRPHRVPWRANGRIPDHQIAALRELVVDDLLRHRHLFVMTHHGPVLPDGRPDHRSHGLRNAAELMDALSAANRSALLFGHVHRRYSYRPPGQSTTLFNAGSATLLGQEGLWLFDVRPDGVRATPGRWRKGHYVLETKRAVDF